MTAPRPDCAQSVLRFVTAHYAATQDAVTVADIYTALHLTKSLTEKAVRRLCDRGDMILVGTIADTERLDAAANTRIYGPRGARVMSMPVQSAKRPPSPYLSKPKPIAKPPVKRVPYRGEIVRSYQPEWSPSKRTESDVFAHRDLALLTRG